jgi:DNA polymerase III gamma/tau subunit
MRAFDLLSTAEQEIRNTSQPRYYFEMVLLRWMHLRKLVPLTDLLEQLGGSGTGTRLATPTSSRTAPTSSKPAPTSNKVAPTSVATAPTSSKLAPTSNKVAPTTVGTAPTSSLKDGLLAEIRAGKGFFYNTVVAQAQKIEVSGDLVTFTFLPAHRALREQFEQSRAWLEVAAERLAGRKISVTAVQAVEDAAAPEPEERSSSAAATAKRDLKAEALSSTGVQALLDVFPAEIRDVEEM